MQHVLTSHENVWLTNKLMNTLPINDTCNICGFIAKNNRRLSWIHSRIHKNDDQSAPSFPCLSNDSNDKTNAVPNDVRCNICNKIFKPTGLPIHIAKVHKEQSNANITAKYQKLPSSPLVEDQIENGEN